MTVEEANKIDLIQVSDQKQSVNLIITDHLDWTDSETEANRHKYALQEKVNSYLAYVESGQLSRDYPKTEGMSVKIQVYGKFDRPRHVVSFYERIKAILSDAGFDFEFILKS